MKKLNGILSVIAIIFYYLPASAQNDPEAKAVLAYMAPGEMHQMMAKSVGTWTGSMTMWMKPGAPPMIMTGETINEMILGGRYLKSTNKATYNGMPFEGIGMMGYDNAKKIFVSTWIDNFGTGMMFTEGYWDAQNKTINFNGKMVDPVSGKDLQVRETMKFVDDNNHYFEMFVNQAGKEFKAMEIKYTRKQ
ncbi:MAG TPA: DUF1579 domain-containing protein [Puia sp.]|nr:DUF1579 domain-containing protein [Puia sp.]